MIPWYIFQHCLTSETIWFCKVRLSTSLPLQLFLLFLALFPAVNSSIWCKYPIYCTETSVPLFLSIPVNIELWGLGNNWVDFGELPCQGKDPKLHLATSVSLQKLGSVLQHQWNSENYLNPNLVNRLNLFVTFLSNILTS